MLGIPQQNDSERKNSTYSHNTTSEQSAYNEGEKEQSYSEEDEEENWNSKAWDLFSSTAIRGSLNIDSFITFASDMNVDCDPALVVRVMKSEKIEDITFRNAIKLLELIPSSQFDTENEQAEEVEGQGNVAIVSPFEYVWRVYLCGEKDPEKEYAISNTFKCSPQFWLLFNASVVFLTVAAAITTFMSLFWLTNALDRESTNLQSLQQTLSFFSNAIASVSLQVSGLDLEDQVVTLSRWMEQVWLRRKNDTLADVHGQWAEDVFLMQNTTNTLAVTGETQIIKYLAATETILASVAMSSAFLVNSVSNWAKKKNYQVYAHDVKTNSVVYDSFLDATGIPANGTACPCIAAIKAAKPDGTGEVKGIFREELGLDGVPGSFMMWKLFPHHSVGVCISSNPSTIAKPLRAKLRDTIDKFNEFEGNLPQRRIVAREYFLFHEDVKDYLVGPDPPNATYALMSKPLYAAPVCTKGSMLGEVIENVEYVDTCQSFESELKRCLDDRCHMRQVETLHYTTKPAILFLSYIPSAHAVVGISILSNQMIGLFEDFLVNGANLLNDNFVKTTEIVFSVRNALGRINAQVTKFRFKDSCLVPCERIYEGSVPMYEAFRTRSSGVSIHPDYTLRPVVGSYSYLLLDGTDVAVTIERDVPELRSISLDLIVQSLDTINSVVDGTTEMMVYQRDGMPATATFDVHEPCPPFLHCISNSEFGMLWRQDCVDCLRRPELNSTEEHYLTSLRFTGRCPASYQCDSKTGVLPNAGKAITQSSIQNPSSSVQRIDGTDYSGTSVLAYVSYIRNYSAYVMVKKDTQEVVSPILTSIIIYVCVAIALVVLGVIGLVFLARRTLNRIEQEWRSYKQSIETEKTRFDGMIREIVPANVFLRFQRGLRAVCDNHGMLSFCNVNICNFSEIYKALTPKQLVRLIAYYFILYDTVGNKFKVFRLKSFGDCGVFVAGLLHGKDQASAAAFTLANFAGYLAQLLTPSFAHFPHRLSQIADAFANDHSIVEDQAAKIYPVRIGIHSGQALTGLIDYGKTPFFEVYGPALSLTHRMMSSAAPSKIHVSTNFKELLETADTQGIFEFDTMRKMVVRGAGTVNSFPMKSIHLPIDEMILHRMKIEYAQLMHNFRLVPGTNATGTRSHSHLDSEESSSIAASSRRDTVESGHQSEEHSAENSSRTHSTDVSGTSSDSDH